MSEYKFNNLSPFKFFILETFPFIQQEYFDAMNEWQLFCKLGEKINELINSQNSVGQETEALYNAFINLQEYINNYFDNLDVQDEINNKLNDMAEHGELEEIITSYIQVKGLLCFNNVQELKNATNVIEGSFARTFGFYDYNDGGGALYKIRKITNNDVVNNMNIISIINDNTLIAELVTNDTINVKCFGAKADGIHDDTLNIQTCLDIYTNKTVYFPSGKYKISSPINTSMYNEEPGNIILDNTAELFTDEELECILYLGNGSSNNIETDKNGVFRLKSHLKGGIINAKNCESGIKLKNNCADIYIEDTKILYFNKYGVLIPANNNNSSSNVHFNKIEIDGNSSSVECYGFYIERPDNKFDDIIINSVRECFRIKKGGQIVNNVHALMVGYDANHDPITNYSEWYSLTKVFSIENGSDNNIFTKIFNDTFCTFVECSNNNDNNFVLTNSLSMSYIPNINQKLFVFNQNRPKFVIANNEFNFNVPDTKHQGIILNNFDSQNIIDNVYKINNNIINQTDRIVKGDLLTKIDNSYTPFWLNSNTDVPDSEWLLIGYTIITTFCLKTFKLCIDGKVYDVNFRLDHYDDQGDVVSNVIAGDTIKNNNVGIDLGFKFENKTNGYYIAGIYIKRTSGTAKCNIDISNMNNASLIAPINQFKVDPTIKVNSVDVSYSL